MPPNPLSMLRQRFTCVRLSHPHMAQSYPRLFHDVHHRGFCPKQLMVVWSLLLQSGSEGPAFISYTAWRSRAFVTQPRQRTMPIDTLGAGAEADYCPQLG